MPTCSLLVSYHSDQRHTKFSLRYLDLVLTHHEFSEIVSLALIDITSGMAASGPGGGPRPTTNGAGVMASQPAGGVAGNQAMSLSNLNNIVSCDSLILVPISLLMSSVS